MGGQPPPNNIPELNPSMANMEHGTTAAAVAMNAQSSSTLSQEHHALPPTLQQINHLENDDDDDANSSEDEGDEDVPTDQLRRLQWRERHEIRNVLDHIMVVGSHHRHEAWRLREFKRRGDRAIPVMPNTMFFTGRRYREDNEDRYREAMGLTGENEEEGKAEEAGDGEDAQEQQEEEETAQQPKEGEEPARTVSARQRATLQEDEDLSTLLDSSSHSSAQSLMTSTDDDDDDSSSSSNSSTEDSEIVSHTKKKRKRSSPSTATSLSSKSNHKRRKRTLESAGTTTTATTDYPRTESNTATAHGPRTTSTAAASLAPFKRPTSPDQWEKEPARTSKRASSPEHWNETKTNKKKKLLEIHVEDLLVYGFGTSLDRRSTWPDVLINALDRSQTYGYILKKMDGQRDELYGDGIDLNEFYDQKCSSRRHRSANHTNNTTAATSIFGSDGFPAGDPFSNVQKIRMSTPAGGLQRDKQKTGEKKKRKPKNPNNAEKIMDRDKILRRMVLHCWERALHAVSKTVTVSTSGTEEEKQQDNNDQEKEDDGVAYSRAKAIEKCQVLGLELSTEPETATTATASARSTVDGNPTTATGQAAEQEDPSATSIATFSTVDGHQQREQDPLAAGQSPSIPATEELTCPSCGIAVFGSSLEKLKDHYYGRSPMSACTSTDDEDEQNDKQPAQRLATRGCCWSLIEEKQLSRIRSVLQNEIRVHIRLLLRRVFADISFRGNQRAAEKILNGGDVDEENAAFVSQMNDKQKLFWRRGEVASRYRPHFGSLKWHHILESLTKIVEPSRRRQLSNDPLLVTDTMRMEWTKPPIVLNRPIMDVVSSRIIRRYGRIPK